MSIKLDETTILNYLDKAIEIRKNAYVPHSNFRVGAIVVDEKGEETLGVNIDNASYGLTNCAERTAIFSSITKGMKKIKLIAVVADTKNPVSPCGACRQVIKEFSDNETIVILGNIEKNYKILTVEELLPYGFEF